MAQNTVDFTTDPSGDQLLDDLLTDQAANFLSMHSGTSRPSYAVAGMMWLDTTSTPWIIKVFDGAQDIPIGTINDGTNKFIPAIGGAVTAEGKITLPATNTSAASLNAPHGTAPTSPVNGDLWTTTNGVYARVNGVTRNLIDAFEYLGTFTATNSATLPVTGVMSSTYDNYLVILDGIRAITDNVSLTAQVSTDNGSSWVAGTSYSHARNTILETGTNNPAGAGGQSSIVLATGMGNSTLESLAGFLHISGVNNVALTTTIRGFYSGVNFTPNFFASDSGGAFVSGTAVNAFRLLMSSGNITGSVHVYGVRKNA